MTNCLEMSEKMNSVAEYINDYICDNGFPPTVRDICNNCNIKSTASAKYYLDKMESLGMIKKSRQKSRAVELTTQKGVVHRDVINIPLVGEIPAGSPKLALEEIDEVYPFPTSFFPSSGDLFMLNVVGSSMIEAGIFDGDIIVVRAQQNADNGQIVVAMIEDCATVKRFYKEKDHIRLHPENHTMRDIITEDAVILGIVVGLVRNRIS